MSANRPSHSPSKLLQAQISAHHLQTKLRTCYLHAWDLQQPGSPKLSAGQLLMIRLWRRLSIVIPWYHYCWSTVKSLSYVLLTASCLILLMGIIAYIPISLWLGFLLAALLAVTLTCWLFQRGRN